MEFWGAEVKAGEPCKVQPEDNMVIHLSQACLGETKCKGNEPVLLSVKVGDKKFVLGTLSSDKFPQLSFDLVFEKEFELSHNWKNGSIHFCGYQTFVGEQEDDAEFDEESDEEEDDIVMPSDAGVQNGKVAQKVEQAKSSGAAKAIDAKAGKPKVTVVEPSKDDEDEDSDDFEEDSSDDDDGSDEDMLDGDDSLDDDDSDDESDEETPKKAEVSKKRGNESVAEKTPPVSSKKSKTASPKTDGKKVGGHTATPHPAKKGGKTPATPATADKLKPQTPKSGGNVSCKSCSKSFGSDKALESHTKAKHA